MSPKILNYKNRIVRSFTKDYDLLFKKKYQAESILSVLNRNTR